MTEEIEELRESVAEFEASFDLRWKADMRAIKRWQAATGRNLTWPDHADLVVWLLERLDEATNESEQRRAALAGVVDAWEILPEGNYGIPTIQSWLIHHMKPAIDKARAQEPHK